jgi:hypothetical protein
MADLLALILGYRRILVVQLLLNRSYQTKPSVGEPMDDDNDRRGVLLPPVKGGTGTYASQGRFIDRLMGDRKIRAEARKEVDELVRRSQEGVDELPADLPPVKPASLDALNE